MKPNPSAAADLKAAIDRHYNSSAESSDMYWDLVAAVREAIKKLQAQQTDTLSELRTQIEAADRLRDESFGVRIAPGDSVDHQVILLSTALAILQQHRVKLLGMAIDALAGINDYYLNDAEPVKKLICYLAGTKDIDDALEKFDSAQTAKKEGQK